MESIYGQASDSSWQGLLLKYVAYCVYMVVRFEQELDVAIINKEFPFHKYFETAPQVCLRDASHSWYINVRAIPSCNSHSSKAVVLKKIWTLQKWMLLDVIVHGNAGDAVFHLSGLFQAPGEDIHSTWCWKSGY